MPIFFVLLVLIIIFLLAGFFRTWQIRNNPLQKEFLKGKLPKPDGLYHGLVSNHKVSWLGKSFEPAKSAGINNFQTDTDANSKVVQKYPFKTYTGKGLKDQNLAVLKIDYDIKANPFWTRWILDEVVSVGENKLLGKVHIRILPGLSFALGYFNLEK